MVIEPNKPTLGLRLIAVFEALKGTVGLAVGFGLHAFAGHHIRPHPFLRSIVHHFHLTGDENSPGFIVELLKHPDDVRLKVWTLLAVFYSALRFTEAYGLWLARRWGEWLAVISAALYLPFEVYALSRSITVFKLIVLLLNIVFVVYLSMVLKATRRKRATAAALLANRGPSERDANVVQK